MNRAALKNNLDSIVAVFGLAAAAVFVYCVLRWDIGNGYKIVCCVFAAVAVFAGLGLWLALRYQVVAFSKYLCDYVDTLSDGELPEIALDEDTLNSKIQMKLDKLTDITSSAAIGQAKQKQEIQKMVSDISHQLKTPIANITMYSSMLQNEGLSKEQRIKFAGAVDGQAQKLSFLVDVLAKMSRLESRLIDIKVKPERIFDTIISGVMQISGMAEKKKIHIDVDCDEKLIVSHDAKWTGEALFNMMDNAVKYTPEGGRITVQVRPWELFTKIDIEDTGIGISPEHYQDIFKRFYRESKVHLTEGVGIGLYLAREIITQQGGYIQVKSQENVGTVFSVFLPNEDAPVR